MIISGTASTLLGGAYLLSGTDSARASVTVDGLGLADAEYESADGTPHAPWVVLTGEYAYQLADADPNPAEYVVTLFAGSGDGEEAYLDLARGDVTGQSGSGTYEIAGDITRPDFYTAADFHAPDPQTETHQMIPVRIKLEIRDDSGETLVATDASESVSITVRNTGTTIQRSATVTGQGQVAMQVNETDAEPTP